MTRSMVYALGLAGALVAGRPANATEPPAPAGNTPPPAVAPAAVQTAKAVVEPAEDLPYDPANRRDPFRPPRAAANVHNGEQLTPLQRYDVGQLRLVAIIYDTNQPRAVVEDEAGLGYIVRVGTPIGPNDGTVRTIERGRVLIQEDSVDFYGEHHPIDVTMDLRTAERGKQ
jgi:type IV pilus assembly protein PilP